MFLRRWARSLFAIASIYIVVGAVALCFGGEWLARVLGPGAGYLTAIGAIAMAFSNHHERKTNGRYRKALEAHRAGTGGSAGDGASPRARGGAVGTGARMSGRKKQERLASGGILAPSFYDRVHLEAMLRSSLSASAPAPKAARPAGEFDGNQVDFAPGVVTGTRSFNVDKLGRLTGVAYKTVWVPGENEAQCMERADVFTFMISGRGVPTAADDVHPSGRGQHSLVDCSHGFYGYYEGSNDYYESGRVMGVVEAYGETIIGSRGFRASKARIVALHIPSEISIGMRRLIARNYPEIPTFDSFDAMVAEFPPDDAGHGITPENDPSFWTRKA